MHYNVLQPFGLCHYWVFDLPSLSCTTLDSAARTCWGQTGAQAPAISSCVRCEEEVRGLEVVETEYLQPYEDVVTGGDSLFDGQCGERDEWNTRCGEDGREVWRLDDSCGGLALSQQYKDVEFRGSFQSAGDGEDWIGFVFGYQNPGQFYIVLAPGRVNDKGDFLHNLMFIY